MVFGRATRACTYMALSSLLPLVIKSFLVSASHLLAPVALSPGHCVAVPLGHGYPGASPVGWRPPSRRHCSCLLFFSLCLSFYTASAGVLYCTVSAYVLCSHLYYIASRLVFTRAAVFLCPRLRLPRRASPLRLSLPLLRFLHLAWVHASSSPSRLFVPRRVRAARLSILSLSLSPLLSLSSLSWVVAVCWRARLFSSLEHLPLLDLSPILALVLPFSAPALHLIGAAAPREGLMLEHSPSSINSLFILSPSLSLLLFYFIPPSTTPY